MARHKQLAGRTMFAGWLALLMVVTSGAVQAADENPLPVDLQQAVLLGDYATALPRLRALVAEENNEARYQLALLNLRGDGVERSVDQAVVLLREASDDGHAKSGYLLGTMYFRGRDVPQDLKAARYYLFAANQQGHRLAGRLLTEIDQREQPGSQDQERHQRQLWNSARAGNLQRAREAIEGGALVNLADENGDPPLILAIRSRQTELAAFLLQEDASVDARDSEQNTALLVAIRVGLDSIAADLIAAGARTDFPNQAGRTALMEAVIAQKPALVRQLLESGASPEVLDKQGKSAVEMAELRDNAMVRQLLAATRGESRSRVDVDQKTALVRRQVEEPGTLYFGWPPLAAAVAQGEEEVVRNLLASDADPWARTPDGSNAILVAIANGDDSTARLLMRHRADEPQSRAADMLRVVTAAAHHDRRELLPDLLALVPPGTNLEVAVDQTPLWQSVAAGNAEIALVLMEWQAPDQRQDEQGRDVLLMATAQGLTDVVRLLLQQGFDAGSADVASRSATWYAADGGHCRLLVVLTDAGASIDQSDIDGHNALIRSAIRGYDDCVNVAIAVGASVDHQTRNGNTALILAAHEQPGSTSLLLAADADVSIRNEASDTALMTAVRQRCYQCVGFLIDAGANPRRQNKAGQSSFDMARDDKVLMALLDG